MYKSFLSILFGLTSVLPATLEASEPSLTPISELEKILKHAAFEAPRMVQEELKIAQHDASRLRGITTHLPAVRMNYETGGFHEVRKSIDSSEATRIGARIHIEANHPVYHWGAIDARRQVGFAQEKLAIDNARIAYAQLATDIRRKYFDLVYYKFEQEVMQKKIQHAQNKLDKLQIQVKSGMAAATLKDQAAIELEKIKLEAAQSHNIFLQKFSDFRTETGYLDIENEVIPTDVPTLTSNIEELKAEYETFKQNGFEQTLPTQVANESIKAIDHEKTIHEARQLPTLNFGLGMTQQPEENSDGKYELQTIFFGGLRGTWNLFDRKETSNTLRTLSVRRRLVNAELAIKRDRLLTTARNSLDTIEIEEKAISLREKAYKVVKENHDLMKFKFEKGHIERAELDVVEAQLLNAELALLRDQTKAWIAYYTFKGSLFKDPAMQYFNPTINE